MPIFVATAEDLAAARLAYHQLVTGQQARVVVDQNGERVEFTSVNRAALYAYILQLESQLNPTPTPSVGPAQFLF